jgi:hypothetical protein
VAVLFHARRQVSLRGGTAIEPDHLLFGILGADRDLLVPYLASDWTVGHLRSSLKGHFLPSGRRLREEDEVPFGPVVRAIFIHAASIAEHLGSRYVEPVHLLVAFLQDTSPAARRLRDCRVPADTIVERLKQSLSQ